MNRQHSVYDARRRLHIPQFIEVCNAFANRIHYTSSATIVFYTTMILLNTLVVLWTAVQGHPNSPTFIVVEIFIALVLILEVSIRLAALGPYRFFRSAINIFDFFVTVACIAAVFTFSISHSKGEEVDDIATFMLVGIRYCVPAFKVAGWFKEKYRKKGRTASLSDSINFERLAEEEDLAEDEDDQTYVDAVLELQKLRLRDTTSNDDGNGSESFPGKDVGADDSFDLSVNPFSSFASPGRIELKIAKTRIEDDSDEDSDRGGGGGDLSMRSLDDDDDVDSSCRRVSVPSPLPSPPGEDV